MSDLSAGLASSGAMSAPPLIGREQELGLLAAGLEDALAGRGFLFVIFGEAGMGKSRLADWVAERARERGAVALLGRCWESVDTPAYWPWIQTVRQLTSQIDKAELDRVLESAHPALGRMVPELGDRIGPLADKEPTRFEEFDALASFLKRVSESSPLVLVLEDVHAADESSLLMLQFLGHEIREASILAVVTYDGAEARRRGRHAGLLADIGREGRHISLGGLNEESVGRLCAEVSGQEPTEAIALALFRASEGNPLYLHEAIRMLTTRGDLHRADYSVGFRVPSGVRDMIARRIDALPEEASAVLSIASVIGREFDAAVLQRVCDLDLESVLDLLARAVSAEIILETGALGRYSFSHILIRETAYEELSAGNRMRLHRRVAEAIEELYKDNLEPRLSELAHHWFKAAQAGDAEKTKDYSVRAAKQASARGAYEEAVRFYQRAIKAAENAGMRSAQIKELRTALKEARAASGAPTTEAAVDGASQYLFAREGEYWTISYQSRTSRIKDSKGLRYMAHLLKNPGREIHVLDLVGATEGNVAAPARVDRSDDLAQGLGDAGVVLDAEAKAAYKSRLEDLKDELEEAREFNDPERAARAQEEIDALVEQLTGAVGLGGRDRKVASTAERARVSVTKTIKDALKRISENDRPLGSHFVSTIKTGTYCSYTPDTRVPIEWRT